jgi:hypothetical protein
MKINKNLQVIFNCKIDIILKLLKRRILRKPVLNRFHNCSTKLIQGPSVLSSPINRSSQPLPQKWSTNNFQPQFFFTDVCPLLTKQYIQVGLQIQYM